MSDDVAEAQTALANLRAARHRVRAVRAITGRVAGAAGCADRAASPSDGSSTHTADWRAFVLTADSRCDRAHAETSASHTIEGETV